MPNDEDIRQDEELSLEQIKQQKIIDSIAWKMVNIFRQFHVINGGIAAVNKFFITADDNVINAMRKHPSGKKLAEHILNLKSGKTKMDSIDDFLLPFGEDVFVDLKNDIYDKDIQVAEEGAPKNVGSDVQELMADMKQNADERRAMEQNNSTPQLDMTGISTSGNNDLMTLVKLIDGFNTSPDALQQFKMNPIVSRLGSSWDTTILEVLQKSALPNANDLINKFRTLTTYDKAVSVWNEAQSIVNNPNNIDKLDVASRLEFFKEYLFMFGDAGKKLYESIQGMVK